ncbi:MAG: XdhC/CoxI family protein [Bacillota bacterium]|nr:XdhC/CoxI family protein [Bacillota bacterium]
MESKILREIDLRVSQGQRAALVILTKNKGSAPARQGSTMAVFQDGSSLGTVGGGAIEYDIMKRAQQAIKDGQDFEFDYNLSKDGKLQMSCGGASQGFVKVFYPNSQLIIFGAGHVGQKLARIAVKTAFDVRVVDDRIDFKDAEDLKDISAFIGKNPEEALADLNFSKDSTYIVVATRGHAQDQEVLENILRKDFKYLGNIGSKAKVHSLRKKLTAKGFSKEEIDKIHMPIGIDIDNGSVEEIAISIMAEILLIKNSGQLVQQKLEFE